MRTIIAKSFSAVLFAALCLCSGRAEAQITVRGYADAGPIGPLQLVGSSRSFTYEQGFSLNDDVYGASYCNGDPAHCVPGATVSLNVLGTNDDSGTATLDGATYTDVNGAASENSLYFQFKASIVLPDLAPTAQSTSSFTFNGTFTYRPSGGNCCSSVSLTGSGIVVVYLHSPESPSFPNSWDIERVVYVFNPPQPGSLLTQTDIGPVGQTGGASINGSQLDVWGSGADIGATTDAFQFAFQEALPPAARDIAVRVDSESAANPDAKAGVMFRSGFDPSAAHVMLAMRPDGGVELLARSAPGGATSLVAAMNVSFPIWLKVHVTTTPDGSGSSQCSYVGSVSADGTAWTPLGSVTFATVCPGDVGLAVTSHDTATVNHALFDNVSIGLPWPWRDADIGAVGLAGNASFVNGSFTVNGAGSDIWGTADSFNYVSQTIHGEGDAQIVARVTSITNTATWAKAGIMIRDPFDAGAANVLLDETPSGTIEFLVRSSAGAAAVGITNASLPFPGWLKLVRSGSTISAFISSDGSTWTNLGSTNVSFKFQPLIGLAVASHNPSQLNAAAFDNVAVTMYTTPPGDVPPTVSITSPPSGSTFAAGSTVAVNVSASAGGGGYLAQVNLFANGLHIGTSFGPPPYSFSWAPNPGSYALTAQAIDNGDITSTSAAVSVTVSSTPSVPSPWTSQDVGSTGLAGSASDSNGTFTVKAAGADIWGAADSFQFVSQPASGDLTLIARVAGMGNTKTWAKAGIMLRASTDPSAANVLLDETPSGTIEFLERSSAGTSTFGIANASLPFPGWLKLVRSGDTVTASISSDGTTWASVGTTTLSIGASALAGLAVTSHDTTQLITATFDNVSVAVPSGGGGPTNIVVYGSDLAASAAHGTWAFTRDSTSPNGTKLASAVSGASNTSAPLATPSDYVDVTFAANAGVPYTLWMRVEATNNAKSCDSLWVQFSDALANGSSVYPLNSRSGLLVNLATDSTASSDVNWGWVNGAYWLTQPATVTFANSGTHTLRVQVREAGVEFDQIVLSPTTYFDESASCPNVCGGAPGPTTNDQAIVPKQ